MTIPSPQEINQWKENAEKWEAWNAKSNSAQLFDKYEKIVERLKNFFNADNVLTKSEYKQKILGGELPLDKAGVDKRILRGKEK